MVSSTKSFAFQGINVVDIDVQVSLSSGIPAFTIVGLANKSVNESKERVRSALNAIGLSIPPKRITINLSPADLIKEGSHFDLAIAIGLLLCMEVLPEDTIQNYCIMGELALDGSITAVNGILPAAVGAVEREMSLICPYNNGQEATWAGDLDIIAPKNLIELINHFNGRQILSPPTRIEQTNSYSYPDMSDIKGQISARRSLEIGAAGSHNILMSGPPGSGKSMLSARLPGILPPLTPKEILEVSIINSISGNIIDGKLSTKRPFRSPHHNCSMPAMVGGGAKAKPGEITLSHNGVLFLDELPEFPTQVLDSLRQPLETKNVTISRAQFHITYPANFQFIAAMNPCKCGYLDDPSRACSKAPKCASNYQSKISGPLLDRIDIHIEVPAIKVTDIYKTENGENSKSILKRVLNAREIQSQRYINQEYNTNSHADGDILIQHTKLDNSSRELLDTAVNKIGLTMRGYNRTLRVARTIADLDNQTNITKNHIAEALTYRQLNFNKKY